MKTISQTYHIRGSVEQVWNALVNVSAIEAWGAGPARMSQKEGDEFSLWGGSIWGKNIHVIPQKKLVQEWYSDEEVAWDTPSRVTFTLVSEGNTTILHLEHVAVPERDSKNIENGWKDYYLGPLQQYVEGLHA